MKSAALLPSLTLTGVCCSLSDKTLKLKSQEGLMGGGGGSFISNTFSIGHERPSRSENLYFGLRCWTEMYFIRLQIDKIHQQNQPKCM